MATYEEVKDVPNHSEIYLIDVRNTDEIESTGSIPASVNIPLPNLEETLEKTDEEFKQLYSRDKPNKNSPIIVTCRSGRRAEEARVKLEALGYANARTYAGSWLEWAEKEGSSTAEAN